MDETRGRAITLIGAIIAVLLIMLLVHFSARAQPKVNYYSLSLIDDNGKRYTVKLGCIAITEEMIHVRVSNDSTKAKNIPIVKKFRMYNKDHYRINHGWLIVSEHGAVLEEGHFITKYTFK